METADPGGDLYSGDVLDHCAGVDGGTTGETGRAGTGAGITPSTTLDQHTVVRRNLPVTKRCNMRYFFFVLTLILGLTSAQAEIAGQNDPQFKAALELWLEGDDDLAALSALSELAKADNRAAQVFLGRVNEATHTHIHVTGPMERKARIALMRQPGGLSGKSWLKAASEDVPLAVAYMQSKIVREKPAAIEALLDFNETAAALIPLRGLLNTGDFETLIQLSEHPNLPDQVSYLRSIAVYNLESAKARAIYENPTTVLHELELITDKMTTDTARFLWEGYSKRQHFGENHAPMEFPANMVENPNFAPIHNFCATRCAEDIPNCMRALVIQQSFNHIPIWIALASPVETLLPTTKYYNSPRVADDLVRLMNSSPRPLWGMERYGQCAYQAVVAQLDRQRPKALPAQ